MYKGQGKENEAFERRELTSFCYHGSVGKKESLRLFDTPCVAPHHSHLRPLTSKGHYVFFVHLEMIPGVVVGPRHGEVVRYVWQLETEAQVPQQIHQVNLPVAKTLPKSKCCTTGACPSHLEPLRRS